MTHGPDRAAGGFRSSLPPRIGAWGAQNAGVN